MSHLRTKRDLSDRLRLNAETAYAGMGARPARRRPALDSASVVALAALSFTIRQAAVVCQRFGRTTRLVSPVGRVLCCANNFC